MRTQLENARQQLHRALASGVDTTTLHAELRQLEARAVRIASDKARAAQAAAGSAAARISAEAQRIVGDADERQGNRLFRLTLRISDDDDESTSTPAGERPRNAADRCTRYLECIPLGSIRYPIYSYNVDRPAICTRSVIHSRKEMWRKLIDDSLAAVTNYCS